MNTQRNASHITNGTIVDRARSDPLFEVRDNEDVDDGWLVPVVVDAIVGNGSIANVTVELVTDEVIEETVVDVEAAIVLEVFSLGCCAVQV